ncbi:hypothetical protein EPN44_10860 [bacterium]|nr:MAG: hypothetical protein EPN44_10860 [bacterium]
MPGLVAAALNDQRIYRIGPRHDPWALPDWAYERALGIADTTAATAVDAGDAETLNALRPLFAATAVEAGFTDVDIAAITSMAPRILTHLTIHLRAGRQRHPLPLPTR